MTEFTSEHVEVRQAREKRIKPEAVGSRAPIERHSEYNAVDASGAVHEERVVRDSGVEAVGMARKVTQLIWFMAGLLEALLGLRFILKLIAANPNAPFANFVYQLSNVFLWPFQALTVTPTTSAGMTLEIFTLIAMIVYALLAWAVVKAVQLLIIPSTSERVSLFRREEL